MWPLRHVWDAGGPWPRGPSRGGVSRLPRVPRPSALSLPCRHSESALQVCRCVLRPAGVHREAPTPATSSSGFYRPAWVHGSGTLGWKLLGEMPSSKREGAGIPLPGSPLPGTPHPLEVFATPPRCPRIAMCDPRRRVHHLSPCYRMRVLGDLGGGYRGDQSPLRGN